MNLRAVNCGAEKLSIPNLIAMNARPQMIDVMMASATSLGFTIRLPFGGGVERTEPKSEWRQTDGRNREIRETGSERNPAGFEINMRMFRC